MPVASAQVKSAILLASLFAKGKTRITEPSASRDHTENMLRYFGVKLKKQDREIEFKCGQELSAQEIEVPGDISSAAFFIVAGLIVPGSEILIRNVGLNPTRTGILDALKLMGAKIEILNLRSMSGEPVGDLLVKSQNLRAAEIKGALVPRLIDEIPILAVAATQAEGTTVIKDAKELRVKESDRIRSMTIELGKLGAKITELPDGMVIEGGNLLKGADVESQKDHRVAMSLAVAGLVAKGRTKVHSVEWVETSFPGFLKKLNQLVA
jgi:3-phosphoshikimate 1-carboxyvinyltransferase